MSTATKVHATIDEVLQASYVVQIHELADLAFIYDTWGERMLASLQTRGGHLPRLPYSPAGGWETAGDHRLWTSLQVPRTIAAWLSECRDVGVELGSGSPELMRWWMDGQWRMREDEVGVLVGVAD